MGYSYSCVPSALAFKVMWGWRQPCFVTNLTAIYLLIVLFSYEQAREQAHLQVKTGRFVFVKKKKNNVTSSLSPIQRSGHSARNCKMVFWVFHTFRQWRVSSSKTSHFSKTIPKLTEWFRKRRSFQLDFKSSNVWQKIATSSTQRGKFKRIGKREHSYVPHTYWYMDQRSLKQIQEQRLGK